MAILGYTAGKYNQGCPEGRWEVSVPGAGGQAGTTMGNHPAKASAPKKWLFHLWSRARTGREMREERGECSREIDFG